VPKIGVAATSTAAGGGVCHEIKALGTLRFAKGFANGDGVFVSFEPFGFEFRSGMERALEGIPALRSAILVVNLASILNEWSFFGWLRD